MANERLREIAEQVTSGLSDDPELRLDVQAEVLSHLEDTAACVVAEEGKSDDEAADFAARTFGSPVDLADTLRDANRARMKTRALLRLAARALLIPAAVLLAVYLGYGGLVRLQGVLQSLDALGASGSSSSTFFTQHENFRLPKLPTFELPRARQRREVREAALERMRGLPSKADRLRALWAEHRQDADARVYYAYYADFFSASSNRYIPFDPNTDKQPPSRQALMRMNPVRNYDFERAMRQGMRVDPTNALYHYKLAAYYLDQGIYAQAEQHPHHGEKRYDVVMNPQLMELGIAEFRAGLRLPTLRCYTMEMVAKRLALLPSSRYTEGYLDRTMCVASELLPYLGQFRALAQKVPGCARVLIAQGRLSEADTLLRAWKPFSAQCAAGSNLVMSLLAAEAFAGMMARESAESYRQLGRTVQAQRTLEELARFSASVEAWKTQQNAAGEPNSPSRPGVDPHARYGSALAASLYWPGTSAQYALAELVPLHRHERMLITEALVSLLMVVLTLALLWHALCGAYLLLMARGRAMPPLLLLPPWPVTAKILGLGVVAPVGVYLLYLQMPQLSGQFESLAMLCWRVAVELGVLLIVLLTLPTALATRYLRRRCLALGLPPVPMETERRERWRVTLLIGGAGVGWCGLVGAGVYFYQSLQYSRLYALLPFILAAALLVLVIKEYETLRIPLIRQRRAQPRPHAAQLAPTTLTFRGTMSRSLLPVYALAVVLLAAVQPYLKQQEAHWLAQDRLFLIRDQFNGITPLEGRLARTLQHDMLQQAEAMHFLEAGR
ncbi:MAG TPA: hypothetical protein VGL77_10365 [Armatimonadota bacterium]|jgi:tetratricopeptide (TPR) repeat protein